MTGLPFSPLYFAIILLFHTVYQSFLSFENFMIYCGATNLCFVINDLSTSILFVKVEAVGINMSATEPCLLLRYSVDGGM